MNEVGFIGTKFQVIKSEFPGINVEVALSKLKQLAIQSQNENEFINVKRLKEYEYLAKEIAELARQRDAVHDALEIETMKATKQRLILKVLPGDIEAEMKKVSILTQKSNEMEIKYLGEKLQSYTDETVANMRKIKRLNAENKKYISDNNSIRNMHDEMKGQINIRMGQKASKQITLNETREKVCEVKKFLAEIDIGFSNLYDDMNEERTKANNERKILHSQMKETQIAIKSQKELVAEEKRVIDGFSENTSRKATKICEYRRDIAEMENAMTRMDMESLSLVDDIERKRRTIDEIQQQTSMIQSNFDTAESNYKEKVNAMQADVDLAKENLDMVEKENMSIVTTKDAIYENHTNIQEVLHQFQIKVKEMSAEYAKEKKKVQQELNRHEEMREKNRKISTKIENRKIKHKENMAMNEKKIEELKVTITEEKHERIRSQKARDESEKALDRFLAQNSAYVRRMSDDLKEATDKHLELQEENLFLVRDIENNCSQVDSLEARVQSTQNKLLELKLSSEEELSKITNTIEMFETDNKKKKSYLSEKEPKVFELREETDAVSTLYHKQKDEMTHIVHKEQSLKDQKRRAHTLIERLKKPMEEMKADIKALREQGVEQLTAQSTQRSIGETEMYFISHKLHVIIHENEVLQESSNEVEDDVMELRLDLESHVSHQNKLFNELKSVQEQFTTLWEWCMMLEKNSSESDHDLLKDIAAIQKGTKARGARLSTVAEILKEELLSLTSLVEVEVLANPPSSLTIRRRSSGSRKHSPNVSNNLLNVDKRSSARFSGLQKSSSNNLSAKTSRRLNGAPSRPQVVDSDDQDRRLSKVDARSISDMLKKVSGTTFKEPKFERKLTLHVPGLQPRRSLIEHLASS